MDTSSQSSDASRILVEKDAHKGIATITINRPDALNALTRPMMEALAKAFNALANDSSTRAIILTGAGRAFCSGVDLSAAQSVFQGDVKDVAADPVAQMERCPVPIIGAINGHAFTAGFEIALACDILLASTSAVFADTHCRFGIFPSWGLSQKLPRLIGANRAREVSLTSAPVDGATAERWGLVSRALAPADLMAAARGVAEAIAGNHPGLTRKYKAVLNDGLSLTLGDGRRLEQERAHDYYTNMKPEEFRAMQEFIKSRSKRGPPKPKARL